MQAGDSKNEPHQEKSPLSSFSVGAHDDGVCVATARAPSQLLSTHGMGQHNNQKGAIGAKERDKQLFSLHLKMKRMLNQKLMLKWTRTKGCEEEGNVFRIFYVFT